MLANLMLAVWGLVFAQNPQNSPKQDAKNAGREAKEAAKDTGNAVKGAA